VPLAIQCTISNLHVFLTMREHHVHRRATVDSRTASSRGVAINAEFDVRNIFLATYSSYTTTDKLLDKLIQRCHAPASVPLEQVKQIQMRVVLILKSWLENHPEDFSENALGRLSEFIDSMGNEKLAKGVRQAISRMVRRVMCVCVRARWILANLVEIGVLMRLPSTARYSKPKAPSASMRCTMHRIQSFPRTSSRSH